MAQDDKLNMSLDDLIKQQTKKPDNKGKGVRLSKGKPIRGGLTQRGRGGSARTGARGGITKNVGTTRSPLPLRGGGGVSKPTRGRGAPIRGGASIRGGVNRTRVCCSNRDPARGSVIQAGCFYCFSNWKLAEGLFGMCRSAPYTMPVLCTAVCQ